MRWLVIALVATSVRAENPVVVPKVGTVGIVPPELMRLDIEVRADGALLVQGRPNDFRGLRAYLRAAEFASVDNVLIRADRSLPWQAIQWIMVACAQSKRHRIFFAVTHEGDGQPGALALFLPTKREVADEQPGGKKLYKVRLVFDGSGATPDELYDAVARRYAALTRAQRERVHVEIEAMPAARLDNVVKACDVIVRAGIRRIRFRAPPPLPEVASLEELVAMLRAKYKDAASTITVDGAKPKGDGKPMPPAKRNTTDYAGSTLPRVGDVTDAEQIQTIRLPKVAEPAEIPSLDRIKDMHARALEWLSKTQAGDGSWKDARGTAVGLLALVWSGHVAKEGSRYRENVTGAAEYLLKKDFGDDVKARALATLAFGGLYLRGDNPRYRQGALDGCNDLLARRGKDGLWEDRETNVLCLAALRAATEANISLEGVDGMNVSRMFFDQADHPDFAGKADTPMEYVLGTLALHLQAGKTWDAWRSRMATELLKLQKKDGSWGDDPYTTALAAMIARRIMD